MSLSRLPVGIDPSATLPITVTKSCPLSCPHCGGHFLKHMIHIDELEEYAHLYRSFLISGGMLPDGRIPYLPYLDKLRNLKEQHGLSYNFHIGFPPEPPVELHGVADVVSFDFFADPKVMESVYGLSRSPEEIIKTVSELQIPSIPHLTVGIACGRITHEPDAIEWLSQHFETIVINVLVPKSGTAFGSCKPPAVEDVVQLFEKAKRRFDNVILGCMHPGGEYRKKLHEALRALATAIVKPVWRDYEFTGCCALVATDGFKTNRTTPSIVSRTEE